MTATLTAQHSTIRVADLQVGDSITQLDTPEGPWLKVVSVGKASLRVTADDGVAVTLKCRPTSAQVLRLEQPVDDGMVPATDRNLIAEKRARLDAPKRTSGRKSGDPRADRARTADASGGALPGTRASRALPPLSLLQPLSAVAYPEALQGHAVCYGACAAVLPVTRFPFIANKGDGKGRMVECGPCQVARLARNKAAKASGGALEPKPRAL